MRVNAASLDIRDATTSTPGTLNDLTTDLIMANNNNCDAACTVVCVVCVCMMRECDGDGNACVRGWMRCACGECRACGWYTWIRYYVLCS